MVFGPASTIPNTPADRCILPVTLAVFRRLSLRPHRHELTLQGGCQGRICQAGWVPGCLLLLSTGYRRHRLSRSTNGALSIVSTTSGITIGRLNTENQTAPLFHWNPFYSPSTRNSMSGLWGFRASDVTECVSVRRHHSALCLSFSCNGAR